MRALLVLVVITDLVAAKGYCPAEENSVDFWSTDTVECIVSTAGGGWEYNKSSYITGL